MTIQILTQEPPGEYNTNFIHQMAYASTSCHRQQKKQKSDPATSAPNELQENAWKQHIIRDCGRSGMRILSGVAS